MSTATEVVIGGCSAGGLGIFMGLDQMADIVTANAKEAGNEYVKVRGLSDSGFFMEHTSSYRAKITHNSYGKDDAVTANSVRHNRGQYFMDYASCMRDLFNYMNLTAGVTQDCIEAQRRLVSQGTVSNTSSFGIESNCVFAAHLVPHIKTPLFLPALLVIAIASVLMAPLGVKAAHALPVKSLKRVFASILYVLAAYMLYKGLAA